MNMDVDRLLNLDEFPADWFAEGIVRIVPERRPDRVWWSAIGDAAIWGEPEIDTRGLIGVSPPYRVED